MEIITKNGYKLLLKKDYLTTRERQEIQRIYGRSAKINKDKLVAAQKAGKTDEVSFDFDLSCQFDVNNRIFEFLVAHLTTPQGEVVKEKILDYVLDLREDIGEEILKAFDEKTKDLNKPTSGEKNNPGI